jgi:DNA invertase Pin-like site-specific DNA recombinase
MRTVAITTATPADPERARAALRAYVDGAPLATMAAELEVSIPRVWQIVQQAARAEGVVVEPRHAAVTDELRARIVEQLVAKVPRAKIVAELGVSRGTVYNVAVAAGLVTPTAKARRRPRR